MAHETVTSTRETLEKSLINGQTTCETCTRLSALYLKCLERTTASEKKLLSIVEGSPDENYHQNMLATRVRLEAACSRRFILHLFQANHSPVGN